MDSVLANYSGGTSEVGDLPTHQTKGCKSTRCTCVLPPVMRLLYISTSRRTGGWLAEAFASDSASKVILEEETGSAAGLARLGNEPFDAVLVSHEPDELDALKLIEGYRVGGMDEPMIVLGTQSEREMAALCYEAGANAYICVNNTTTRNLIWVVALSMQRIELIRENDRLHREERRRMQQEHNQAERLLKQQWALVDDVETLGSKTIVSQRDGNLHATSANVAEAGQEFGVARLPEKLLSHYRELLRTYVIMGSGNLEDELERLASLLVKAGVTARQSMHMHLCAPEELIRGLGARSARHVMTRADLLVLEIMVNLAEGYHIRYLQRSNPPLQMTLPGFDEPATRTCKTNIGCK